MGIRLPARIRGCVTVGVRASILPLHYAAIESNKVSRGQRCAIEEEQEARGGHVVFGRR